MLFPPAHTCLTLTSAGVPPSTVLCDSRLTGYAHPRPVPLPLSSCSQMSSLYLTASLKARVREQESMLRIEVTAFLNLISGVTQGITFAILHLLEVKGKDYSRTWIPEHRWPSTTRTFNSFFLPFSVLSHSLTASF